MKGYIILLLIFYTGFSFCILELNPLEWVMEARIAFTLVVLWSWFVLFMSENVDSIFVGKEAKNDRKIKTG